MVRFVSRGDGLSPRFQLGVVPGVAGWARGAGGRSVYREVDAAAKSASATGSKIPVNALPEASRPASKRGSDTAFSVYDPLPPEVVEAPTVAVPTVARSSSIMATLIATTSHQPAQPAAIAAKHPAPLIPRESKCQSVVHPGELVVEAEQKPQQPSRSAAIASEGDTAVGSSPLQAPLTKKATNAASASPRSQKVGNGTKDEGNQQRITRVMIDGIQLRRRDQARILEQTLQLLFSCEVLIFVEYLEVLMPSLYGLIVGGLWPLHNARYNMLFISMTRHNMETAVAGSFVYAALESLSLLVLAYILKRRYGISALHLLAFVLEKYWKVLHGKMTGALLVIWLTLTVHQGVDFTFTYDYGVILQRVGSWRLAS